jgi:hypothetical protein
MALIILSEGAEVCRYESKQTNKQTGMCCHAFVSSTLLQGVSVVCTKLPIAIIKGCLQMYIPVTAFLNHPVSRDVVSDLRSGSSRIEIREEYRRIFFVVFLRDVREILENTLVTSL